jgi:hypothetical protein
VDPGSVTLNLRDAVDLGHAWAAHVAEDLGIRVLLIKGPSLHAHGLRKHRVSRDVDVLVDPRRFEEYCAAIESAGWTERPETFVSARFTVHSRCFSHEGWPCDLDVHRWFPGFLAEPSAVFDALWDRREPLEFAHRACAVPDRIGDILILSLHSLRSSVADRRHRAELEHVIATTVLTEKERADAASLALATGCAATLEDVLPRLGVLVAPPHDELVSLELRAWRERVISGSSSAYLWMAELRRAPWHDRFTLVGRAIWPSTRDLHLHTPDLVPAMLPRLRARLARYGRGLRSLPAAARALRLPRGA